MIKVYYWAVSPWLGSRCRYAPSCSEYAIQALDQHGAIKGSWLSIKRIARCHPWGGEGHDPVPISDKKNNGKKNDSSRNIKLDIKK